MVRHDTARIWGQRFLWSMCPAVRWVASKALQVLVDDTPAPHSAMSGQLCERSILSWWSCGR